MPKSRRSYNSLEFTEEYWYRLLCYLHDPPRQLLYVQAGGHRWRIPRRSPFVQAQPALGLDEYVEVCRFENQNVDTERVTGHESSAGLPKFDPPANEDGPRIGKKASLKKLIQFIMQHLTSPLKNLVMSKPWMTDPEMIHFKHGDRQVDIALGWVMQKLLDMSLEDLIMHCVKHKDSILFRLDKTFHNIQDSIKILVDLFGFQYNYNKRRMIQFLYSVYNIVNKSNGEQNALLIIGPQNCCKSYFINTLGTLFINYGVMESPLRNNNFPFMDCAADNRVIIWDGVTCDRYYYDSIKKLMSGEPLSVSVKYSGISL